MKYKAAKLAQAMASAAGVKTNNNGMVTASSLCPVSQKSAVIFKVDFG
jgi:hypothetical protein